MTPSLLLVAHGGPDPAAHTWVVHLAARTHPVVVDRYRAAVEARVAT